MTFVLASSKENRHRTPPSHADPLRDVCRVGRERSATDGHRGSFHGPDPSAFLTVTWSRGIRWDGPMDRVRRGHRSHAGGRMGRREEDRRAVVGLPTGCHGSPDDACVIGRILRSRLIPERSTVAKGCDPCHHGVGRSDGPSSTSDGRLLGDRRSSWGQTVDDFDDLLPAGPEAPASGRWDADGPREEKS